MSELKKVLKKSELPKGTAKSVDVNGKKIAIFNVEDKFYAIDDECTHAGAPLSEGTVEGTKVICPWHSAEFDLTTGEALAAPAFEGIKAYKVSCEDDDIKIEI